MLLKYTEQQVSLPCSINCFKTNNGLIYSDDAVIVIVLSTF